METRNEKAAARDCRSPGKVFRPIHLSIPLLLLVTILIAGIPLVGLSQTASPAVKVRVGFSSLPLEIRIDPPAAASSPVEWVDADHPVMKDAMAASAPAGAQWTVQPGKVVRVASEAGMLTLPSRKAENQNSFETPAGGAPPPDPNSPPPAVQVTLDEFAKKRPDIFELIPSWNSSFTDRAKVLKEWVKITTERGDDYKAALKILEEMGK